MKHCGKRRKCWLPALSPSPTLFSKAFFLRVIESRDCLAKLCYNEEKYVLEMTKKPTHLWTKRFCPFEDIMVTNIFSFLYDIFKKYFILGSGNIGMSSKGLFSYHIILCLKKPKN